MRSSARPSCGTRTADASPQLRDQDSLGVPDGVLHLLAGLLVHPYTFRNENSFLPADFRQGNPDSPVYLRATGDAPAEYRLFFRLGVDGLFSDNPDTAVASRHRYFNRD